MEDFCLLVGAGTVGAFGSLSSMNRYKITKQLGDGTYGSVLKGVNRQTGEVVRHDDFVLQSRSCLYYQLVSLHHTNPLCTYLPLLYGIFTSL